MDVAKAVCPKTDDFPSRVDPVGKEKVEGGIGCQRVEIDHAAVETQKCPRVEVCVK